jgi:prevent-host-death family protein
MSKYLTPTETLKFTEARPKLSELLNRVYRREARIVIQKGDIPVAALVSMNDLERLEKWSAEREANFAILDEIGAVFADLSPEEIESKAAEALAWARAEARAGRKTAVNE